MKNNIELQNVSKQYQGFKLKNISFNIISTLPFLNLSIRNLIIPNTPKKIKYNNDMLILTKKNEIRLDAK